MNEDMRAILEVIETMIEEVGDIAASIRATTDSVRQGIREAKGLLPAADAHDFGEALRHMDGGCVARREGWITGHAIAIVRSGRDHFETTDGDEWWFPSIEDLLATDWEIAP